MQQYKDLIDRILKEGSFAEYRNGTRISVFGAMLRFDLQESFPLVSIKETKCHDAFVDLVWMISGSNRVSDLDKLGMKFNFWKRWAVKGTIGNLYGKAWREAPNNGKSKYPDELVESGEVCPSDKEFGPAWIRKANRTVDQLADVIYGLRNHRYSSRHRISTYIPEWSSYEGSTFEESHAKGKGVITPCASLLHFTVKKGEMGDHDVLNLHVTQASSDVLIGLPVNLAQYALFVHLVGREVGILPGELIYTLNDAHIYKDQLNSILDTDLMDREPQDTPIGLELSGGDDIYHINIKDILVTGYDPKPFISIPVSV